MVAGSTARIILLMASPLRNLRRLLPVFRMEWMIKREAPTNFTHVCVTTGNLLAGPVKIPAEHCMV